MARLDIKTTMLRVLSERGTATACPSEVGRALDPDDWRRLMPAIREVAHRLQRAKKVDVYQRGRPVDALTARGPIRLRLSSAANIDYRQHAERYVIGRGEQGVLTVEPYRSELLPLWRFATPTVARESVKALWARFVAYGKNGDFVGMDMARKFLQMGWTRSRRSANHPSGRKYAAGTQRVLPRLEDALKAQSAQIFRKAYERALKNPRYRKLKATWPS